MTRPTASTITDDQLNALWAERDTLLAELAGRDEEAQERWINKQLDETGIRAMEYRNGASLELEPAREAVAHWVGVARGMLGEAPNYSETPISMEVKVAEDPERFAFVLQRVGKLTPHEARRQAEAERDQLAAILRDLTDPDPCSFDHHGYCQTHPRLTDEGPCPHARAQEALAARGPADAERNDQ